MFIQARISVAKAISIVIVFIVVTFGFGYFWAATHWMNTEKRNVYQFRTDLLEERLQASPGDLKAMLDLGMSQYLEGNPGAALKTYQDVLEQEPDNINAMFYMGLIKTDMKDFTNAVPLLEKVVSKQPTFQPALLYHNLGVAYYHNGNYQKAVKNFKLAIGVQPGSGMAQYYLGLSYFELGQLENAQKPLEKALEFGINTKEVQQTLTLIKSRLNNGNR